MKPLFLTVGNIYVDHNVYGVQSDPFRLEEGEDYMAASGERVLGGSAINVALQVGRLGVEVGFVGKVGEDADGQEVRSLLGAAGIRDELIVQDAARTTSMAINLVGESGQFTGVHYGDASKSLSAADINVDHPLLDRCEAIYFGGTAKQPELFPDCAELFSRFRRRNIMVFFDPNRFPAHQADIDRSLLPGQLASVEGYFPNETELLQATGKTAVDAALDSVIASGVKFVALKRGARGCRIKTAQHDFEVSGHLVTAKTTVGAGDCFNATFMVRYISGSSLKECAEAATAAAAIKVSQNIWPDNDAIKLQIKA